ncbi:MAG: L,D-transpeptidase [Akkermansiaceae bacterium]
MATKTVFAALICLVTGIGFSSCSMNAAGGGINSYLEYDRPATLPSDPSAVEVKVSLSRQRAYVMEGTKMLLAMPVSIGRENTPTPQGRFKIFKKEAKYRDPKHGYLKQGNQVRRTYQSNQSAGSIFRGTPMPYWCEFKEGYAFHTGWIKHTPCTNGCIRMHQNLAPKFFHLVSIGTPVSISYSQPEDEKWTNIPLPPDAGPLPNYPEIKYWDGSYFSQHKTPEYE